MRHLNKEMINTFAETRCVISLFNSVEQLAPNIRAIRHISVVSGFVSRGITLEKRILVPASTSARICGIMF
jgi:hypothetical protein